MTFRTLVSIALCSASLAMLAMPAAVAGPNAHANAHAQSHGGGNGGNGNNGGGNNGGGGGNGGGGNGNSAGTPHSVVRQYAIANGLKQGEVARTLKSWNSLNANPRAFLNSLDNPNSLHGKQAKYICDSATAQAARDELDNFESGSGADELAAAQDYLTALELLGGSDPQAVLDDPESSDALKQAADLVLASDLTEESAQAIVDDHEEAVAASLAADQQATDSFAAASVGAHGSTDLAETRATVDAIIAQKGLDTSALCGTSVASTP